jgi:hypothetical protein
MSEYNKFLGSRYSPQCLPSTPMLYYPYVLIIVVNKNLALASIVLKALESARVLESFGESPEACVTNSSLPPEKLKGK